jgi:hypothetical protein
VLDLGAGSNSMTLKRSPEGLTCTADGPNLQEVGRGPTQLVPGAVKGQKVEILSLKQLSSTCRVQLTEQVNDNDGFWTPRGPARPPGNCVRCLTKCTQCGASEGSPCFQKCRAAGNPLVRSASVCRPGGLCPARPSEVVCEDLR